MRTNVCQVSSFYDTIEHHLVGINCSILVIFSDNASPKFCSFFKLNLLIDKHP